MVLRMPLISAEHWHSPSCIAYEDPTIGFIAAQVGAHIGDWANFTKSSAAS